MKVTAFDAIYSQDVGMGGTLLISSDGSNSGVSGGDIAGESGDLSVVRLRSSVALSSNLTGTVGDVLTIIQNSPLTAQFATPSNSAGGAAFGSNSTFVSETTAVGASSNTSRADHTHGGISLVTASSSNTLQRGTFNLRPGTGIGLSLSDTDGSGAFDTVTIVNTTGATSASGSLAADSSPFPTADDDEFTTALSGWTTLGSLNTSTTAGSYYHIVKADAGLQIHGIYKTAPATPFTVTVKFADYSLKRGNYTEYHLALGDATPTAWMSFGFSTFNQSFQRDTWTNNTTRSASANGTTNHVVGNPKYLRLVVNSTSDVDCYYSFNGLVWDVGLVNQNPGFANKIGIVVSPNGQQADAFVDWIRFGTDVVRSEVDQYK